MSTRTCLGSTAADRGQISGSRFQLAQHPWLSLLIVILAEAIAQVLFGVLVVGVFKRPHNAPLTQFMVSLLGHIAVLFVMVPFVLRLPTGTRSFGTYADAIRLNRVRPFLQLLLLGLSCYLILALCQASGVLVYRAFQGRPVTAAFVRGAFDLSGELPPKSWHWLFSLALPSALEEVAFRGVVLTLFFQKYPERPAVLFAALGFGASHLLHLGMGLDPVGVLGQALWATLMGLFYGFLVLRSNSLWPAMVVHYLGNLFVGALTSYLQTSATLQVQAAYGVIFTFGLVPTTLMVLWVFLFTTLWPIAD
jgi:membrane protease YdiL (CAAX protease family)